MGKSWEEFDSLTPPHGKVEGEQKQRSLTLDVGANRKQKPCQDFS